MGFGAGRFAKIWNINKGTGNFYVAEMSTSKKMKVNGQDVIENGKAKYETDWSNKFVRLVGTAAKQAETIMPGDSRKIESCEVTNHWDKAKQVLYTNYTIFAFAEDGAQTANSSGNAFLPENAIDNAIDKEELPFA